jgi:phage portal protein BeeE
MAEWRWTNKDQAAPHTASFARDLQAQAWKRARPSFGERIGQAFKVLTGAGYGAAPLALAGVPGGIQQQTSLGGRLRNALSYAVTGDPRAFFPPGTGLQPQAPADAKPRRWDYPPYYNTQIPPRSYESISFSILRDIADSHDLTRLIIETAKNRIATQAWDIIPIDADAPKNKGDLTKAIDTRRRRKKTPAGQQDRINALKTFFRCPDGRRTFSQWSRMLLEDLFVLDAMTVYVDRSLSGDVYALRPVDGGTISVKLDYWGEVPSPPETAYQQVLRGLPAIDYSAAGTYACDGNDAESTEYQDGELLYMVHNQRTHRAYGLSALEQVMLTLNIAIRRQIYQMEFYRSASIPEYIIETPPDWTPNQIEAAQDWFQSQFADSMAARWRALLLPNGCRPMETKQVQLKDDMDDWLARVLSYAFSVDPSQLQKQMSRASSQHGQEQSDREGFQPFSNFFAEQIDRMIRGPFGMDDVEFVFQSHTDPNTLQNAQMFDLYVKDGIMTRNEVRDVLGLEPLDDGDAPGPPPPQPIGGLQNPAFGNAPPFGNSDRNLPGPGHSNPPPAPNGRGQPGASAKQPNRQGATIGNSPAAKPASQPSRTQTVNGETTAKASSMAHARAHQALRRAGMQPHRATGDVVPLGNTNLPGGGSPATWPRKKKRKRAGATVTIPYQEPKDEHVKRLKGIIHRGLKEHAASVAHAVVEARRKKVRKAGGDDDESYEADETLDAFGIDLLTEEEIRDLIKRHLLQGWEDYPDEIASVLEEAANDGALSLIGSAGIDVSAKSWDRIDQMTTQMARDRGGELVGMKYDQDAGQWVENPNAQWAITEDVRNELASLVAEAEAKNWSNSDLSDAIQNATTFGEDRADMVARTELKRIDGMASRKTASETGASQKSSNRSDDDFDCDDCQANEEAGWIDVDEDFPSGDSDVPFHPNCKCSTRYRWPDQEGEDGD